VTSWKNGRNGAIAKTVSDIRFIDFKVADNKLAGMEISETAIYRTKIPQIQGGLCVGRSKNADPEADLISPRGVITSRTENFHITGTKFYSYPKGAAIGSCSHCTNVLTSDSGARQCNTSGLYFDDATVPKRI